MALVRQSIFEDIILRPGYISVVSGEPGTGKTFLALRACIENAKRGKKSTYFTFNEDADTIRNRLRDVFGFEREGYIDVKEAITLGGKGVGALTAEILSSVKASSLLVLDSLDALMVGIELDQERRTLLQSLYRAVKLQNTGLLMISESEDPYHLAGYAADAYMAVTTDYVEGRIYRYVKIRKARDVPVYYLYCTFTPYKGFTEIPHLDEIRETGVERPIADEHMRLFMKGARIIVEFDNNIPYFFMNEMKRVFAAYFLDKGHGVMYFTSYDEDGGEVRKRISEIVSDKRALSNLLVMARKEKDVGGDMLAYWSSFHDVRKNMAMELKRKTGNRTVISIFSLWFNDLVYSSIGEKHISTIQRFMRFDKKHDVKSIGFTSTGVRVNDVEKRITDGYFKFILKHGRVFVYGEKPCTILYGVTVNKKEGKWGYDFLPMI